MACLGYYCAHPAPLVVQLRLLPPRTSNARVCLIIIRCRHCARLSFIVLHRMLFVDQYFRRASGSRGSGRCLHMVWAWPERGKRRGRSGKAGEASIDRALLALLAAHDTACAPRSAILSVPAACGGQGSGLWRWWRVSEVGRSNPGRRIA